MAASPLKLEMVPPTGERLLRFVGDRIRFMLRSAAPLPDGWRGLLRTNLGRGSVLRREIITSRGGERPMSGESWRDIPMRREGDEWFVELAFTEVGWFKAKAYAVDERGWQIWPDGPDIGLSVHPDSYRTANTIYCAFTRLFGETKTAVTTADRKLEAQLKQLDKQGYTIIPASGKLRDLVKELPHIIDTLGCRILHLLPVNPTPTTYARFGRFGSPYAALDLTSIDPALIEFDRRTTGVEQFRELAYAVHAKGARLVLDLVINHTGWSSSLQEQHPDWFLRGADGAFVSPGAWGVTWEDLVELSTRETELWDCLAEAFLTWCRRGVDGFRCDAGYKVPMPVWQYITARVREEFPETLFLLEGLGGGWKETESLLTEGGMQWAYSELFQEFSGPQVAGYLDHAHKQSRRVGVLVHYSETHDNDRLAKKGRAWTLLRNRLCALASLNGAYGFTCGVEWLATEKILVHGCAGLAWGSENNVISELARLNQLMSDDPCFFDGAEITRLSPAESQVFALQRVSADGQDTALVLVNTDIEKAQTLTLSLEDGVAKIQPHFLPSLEDLLGQAAPKIKQTADGKITFTLESGGCYCLAPTAQRRGLSGGEYRRVRAQAAWAIGALSRILEPEEIGPHDWRGLAEMVSRDPKRFLGSLAYLEKKSAGEDLLEALNAAAEGKKFPSVVTWSLIDRRRITLVPLNHWLLVEDAMPFRVTLRFGDDVARYVESVAVRDGHIACFSPSGIVGDAKLILERYVPEDREVRGAIRFLSPGPPNAKLEIRRPKSEIVLLTNGIGGMARLCVDLGRVTSKYDCLLGANLNADVPVDRHIFAKRVRVWANANGFISALNADNLVAFEPGPPALWRFAVNAGDGQTVEIQMTAEMIEGQNTTLLRFSYGRDATKRVAPTEVRLTVRVDIEDRNFHQETKRDNTTERHFSENTRPLADKPGFRFAPATDRQLSVFSDAGEFHAAPEWCENIPHPAEASRGQIASGDAYSPGWYDLPLAEGKTVTLVVTAESGVESSESRVAGYEPVNVTAVGDAFGSRLLKAAKAFVVRRGEGKTVIAGYPWFLDWGRDTLICARGLLNAGMIDEVKQILVTFARFEEGGTLPNTIHGEDASNRDTSDASLWFGIVCEELAAAKDFYSTVVDKRTRTIADILRSIATHYRDGTPNGIRMDPESALIWSPSHFTWMDTNHPAGTPREGYPIEIQVLWIRLLRQLERIGASTDGEPWNKLAERAEASLQKLYWLEDRGYFADCLIARAGESAASAQVDTALRSNYLFAVSLGLVAGEKACRCVDVALRYLVVPGALRSLAPLPVSLPLPIHGNDGHLLNKPDEPYYGRYEGDEDTQRKPAYHNGTGWVWTLPTFSEALARAWDFSAEAVAAGKAYLGSTGRLLDEGCVGQLPEIVDGDAPHEQRGCDAQAWSVTEVLRVWMRLREIELMRGEESGGKP
jgi:predicted glycogen debranching enzyme